MPRAQVSYVASALTAGNPADAMSPFDKSVPGYDKLRGYFSGLTGAFELTNQLEVTEEQDSKDEATLTLEWTLTLTDPQTGYTMNRNATIHARLVPKGGTWKIVAIESDCGNGRGFSKTALTMPKIAVFAPMPRVSMANVDSVKPGLLRRPLTAYWSCLASSLSMIHGLRKHAYYHRGAPFHIRLGATGVRRCPILGRRLVSADRRYLSELPHATSFLSRDFRIGQNIFDRGEFGFGQKLGVRKPIRDRFVKGILIAHARAKDPNRFLYSTRDYGRQKRLGRRDDVGKFYRRALCPNLPKFLGDRFRLRDGFEQFARERFFHARRSPKLAPVQSGGG